MYDTLVIQLFKNEQLLEFITEFKRVLIFNKLMLLCVTKFDKFDKLTFVLYKRFDKFKNDTFVNVWHDKLVLQLFKNEQLLEFITEFKGVLIFNKLMLLFVTKFDKFDKLTFVLYKR